MKIPRRRTLWAALVSCACFCLASMWFQRLPHTSSLEMSPWLEAGLESAVPLPLASGSPPTESIMLLEGYNNTRLTARMLCALESAARAHYPTPVTLFMTASVVQETQLLKNLTKELPNISLRHLNVSNLFSRSPLAHWFSKRRWRESYWPQSHFNDAVRWLLLWLYGGVYLDLDVVTLRPLTSLPNCTGLESHQWAAAGVLKFTPAHPLIEACLEEFAAHFDGNVWGANGPKLLTRVLVERCGLELPSGRTPRCPDVTVYSPKAFYPIPWWDWKQYLEEGSELSKKLLEDPEVFALHMWNLHSRHVPVLLHSDQPYARAARIFCPVTAAHAGPVM